MAKENIDVGSILYVASRIKRIGPHLYELPFIYECKITSISSDKNSNKCYYHSNVINDTICPYEFLEDEIGKTIFFTKEEAMEEIKKYFKELIKLHQTKRNYIYYLNRILEKGRESKEYSHLFDNNLENLINSYIKLLRTI